MVAPFLQVQEYCVCVFASRSDKQLASHTLYSIFSYVSAVAVCMSEWKRACRVSFGGGVFIPFSKLVLLFCSYIFRVHTDSVYHHSLSLIQHT